MVVLTRPEDIDIICLEQLIAVAVNCHCNTLLHSTPLFDILRVYISVYILMPQKSARKYAYCYLAFSKPYVFYLSLC